MPAIILFTLLFFIPSFGYGQEAPEGRESLREEPNAPFYAQMHVPVSRVKESHAYYNRHAGQMVEVSVIQTDRSEKTGPISSGRAREIRSFYNRHAGQKVEMPMDGKQEAERSVRRFGENKSMHKFNPYSRQWEKTSPDTQLTYNPHAGVWSYEKQGAYPRYNPHSGAWEQATDDETLQYNRENDGWSYDK